MRQQELPYLECTKCRVQTPDIKEGKIRIFSTVFFKKKGARKGIMMWEMDSNQMVLNATETEKKYTK